MKPRSSSIPTLIGAALLLAGPLRAQSTGVLVVTVIDDDNGQAVEAARVYIPGVDLGGLSDEKGRLVLPDLPVGKHEVRAELIGYSRASATLSVQAGITAAVESRPRKQPRTARLDQRGSQSGQHRLPWRSPRPP